MIYSGRYTGYQFYPDRQFNEAVDARTPPYTQRQYQCPHSSRTYQFASEDTPARQHYDAAVTTCCDEPVRPFSVHPQYEELDRPLRARDCSDPAARGLCNTFFFSASSPVFPALTAPMISGIQVGCLQRCGDDGFGSLQWEESWRGESGTFVLRARTTELSIVDYHGESDPSFYNRCGGTDYRGETVCGGQGELRWAFRAEYGGAYPCDCCNNSGQGITPVPNISWTQPAPTWKNESLVGTVRVSETCSGAKLSATWKGSSSNIVWNPSPAYHFVTNVSRYTEGYLLQIGDSSRPVCCGGTLGFSYDNGCGWSKSASGYTPTKIQTTVMTPADGTVLNNGISYRFQLDDACSYTSAAGFEDAGSYCMQPISWDAGRSDGVFWSNYVPQTAGGEECPKCCGRGILRVQGNNGCGGTIEHEYRIKLRDAPSVGGYVGWDWTVVYESGSYVTKKTEIGCDGSYGSFSYEQWCTSEQQCIDWLAGRDATGLCGESLCCVELDQGVDPRRRIVYTLSEGCCSWLGDGWNPTYLAGAPDSCCP